MNALVAFESRAGHTEAAAHAIAAALEAGGAESSVKPMGQTTADDVSSSDLLVIGSWIEGFVLFGVGPARSASAWLEQLANVEGKAAAVFCTYAFHPRRSLDTMRSALETKGARVVATAAFHRRKPEVGTVDFAARTLAAVQAGG